MGCSSSNTIKTIPESIFPAQQYCSNNKSIPININEIQEMIQLFTDTFNSLGHRFDVFKSILNKKSGKNTLLEYLKNDNIENIAKFVKVNYCLQDYDNSYFSTKYLQIIRTSVK
jgi:hypothetical protein